MCLVVVVNAGLLPLEAVQKAVFLRVTGCDEDFHCARLGVVFFGVCVVHSEKIELVWLNEELLGVVRCARKERIWSLISGRISQFKQCYLVAVHQMLPVLSVC